MTTENVSELAGLVLADDDGRPARVGDAWKDRPAVVAFLRHFGCIFCRRRVAELLRREAEIRAAGGSIAVVGLGTPAFAKAFRASMKYEGPLFVDGEGAAYRTVALKRMAFWRLLSPRMIRGAFRARRAGFRQGKVEGDPWQLGGTLVVAPGDHLVYRWRNTNADDDAPLDDVIAALRAASA